MINTVFFDFGGVFTFSPFTAIDEADIARSAAPGQFTEIMFGSYHENGDHSWHRLERGEITIEEACIHILELGRAQGLAVDL